MKKLYFTILSAIFCLGANAQTITVGNHAPLITESYTTRQCDSTGINPGAGTGSGQSWNFSSINTRTYNANTNYSVVSVSSTGSASAYPSASVAVNSGTNNSFYSNNSSNFYYYGGNLQIGTFAVTFGYTSPAIMMQYPTTLNASITNTVAGTISIAGNNGVFTGTNTNVADATGTLSLPGRTLTNVMRVVNTQAMSFTIIVSGTVTQKVYDYYDISVSKTPILTVNTSTINSLLGNSTQTIVTVNGNYKFVGITENTKEISDLNLYPNPAKTNIILSFTNANAENGSYEIMNAIGQTVKKENIGNDKGIVKHSIDIESLESGIYFVKVILGNSSSVKKVTIQ